MNYWVIYLTLSFTIKTIKMKIKYLFISVVLLFSALSLNSQSLRIIKNALSQEDSWYGSQNSIEIADNVLLFQKENGGWPKNNRMFDKKFTNEEKQNQIALKNDIKEATIDNGATYIEMVFLARMYQATKNTVYKDAFCKGLNFIFSLQYDNGGFKQFSRDKGYYTHITFNDNATNNIMQLLRAVNMNHKYFTGIADKSLIEKSVKAFDKGIECILNTQYLQNGKKTVWCAQHDEKTLLPAKARAYELPSLSGSESVGLTMLLMDLPNPDNRVKEAVNGAMEWFDKNRIKDKRLESFINSDGKRDRRMINSTQGEDLWGRFCDLQTNKAFVSDRDGIVKYDISEIGYERRNGYSWFTSEPNKLFKLYEKWKTEKCN